MTPAAAAAAAGYISICVHPSQPHVCTDSEGVWIKHALVRPPESLESAVRCMTAAHNTAFSQGLAGSVGLLTDFITNA